MMIKRGKYISVIIILVLIVNLMGIVYSVNTTQSKTFESPKMDSFQLNSKINTSSMRYLETKWELNITYGENDISEPIMGPDGDIIIATRELYEGFKIHSVDKDGSILWGHFEGNKSLISMDVGRNGKVFFVSQSLENSSKFVFKTLDSQGRLESLYEFSKELTKPNIEISTDPQIVYVLGSRRIYRMNTNIGGVSWNRTLVDTVCPTVGEQGGVYYINNTNKSIVKLDKEGENRWNKRLSDQPAVLGLIAHGDGEISLAYSYNASFIFNSFDLQVSRFTSSGTELWNCTFEFSNGGTPDSFTEVGGQLYFILRLTDEGEDSNQSLLCGVNEEGEKLLDGYGLGGDYKLIELISQGGSLYVLERNPSDLLYITDIFRFDLNGTLRYGLNLESDDHFGSFIHSQGTIYMTSSRGNLSAFEVKKREVSKLSSPRDVEADSSHAQVDLSWDVPSHTSGNNITEYRIYRGTSSGNLTLYDSVDGNTTSFTDTEVTNDQTYYYKVSAVTSVGEGNKTIEVSATPTADDDDGGTPGFTTMLLLLSGLVSVAIYYRKKR